MKKIAIRIVAGLLVVLVLLVVLSAGAGYWFVTKSFPQTTGTVQIPGLKSAVTVIRDASGVPHIYADSQNDLYMAQGYVHAQDRLWQMEMNRHVGHGQLAELFGDDFVDEDSFLRTIGLARAAKQDLENVDPTTLGHLQKYADGVNAFLHTHQDNLPIEFTLLGTKPRDWEPLDTLVWGKVMAYDLSGNYDRELLRAALKQELGESAMQALIPEYPADGPFIIPKQAKPITFPAPFTPPDAGQKRSGTSALGEIKFSKLIELNESFGIFEEGIGSNNWVVDGTKTTTGKPLLANDPHLGIQMPSIWYANALHCNTISPDCPFNVAGYSFVGVPGVIIGHNDKIAWGVTNVGPDVQDLYIEKINPANPNQYEYQGKWEDMELVRETIKVKGGNDVDLTIRLTRHGPIMTEVLEGVREPLALKWTATAEPSQLFAAVAGINAATNWEEFRAALKNWDVPAQNFVYADQDGNIGYQTPGRIPIRAKGDGTLPVEGWTGENEWIGYIPFEELPSVLNPSDHYVVTANNQVVPNDYKYNLGNDWAVPYRAQRITDLIEAKDKLSPEDFQSIQGDVYSIPLAEFKSYIQGLPAGDATASRAMEFVESWDGRVDREAQAPAILEATYHALVRELFERRMSAETFGMYRLDGDAHRLMIDGLLDEPQNDWWDDPATPARETRDDRLKIAFKNGLAFLTGLYGNSPGDWKWGRIHTATFEHPFGSIKPLNLIMNLGPVPSSGHGFTITNGGYRPNADNYAQRTVSSMRYVADLSGWDKTLWIHTTGQSGQPFNSHYGDLMLLWRDVKYEILSFSRAAVDKMKAAELTLRPQ